MGGMDEINLVSEDIKTKKGEVEDLACKDICNSRSDNRWEGRMSEFQQKWQPGGKKRYRERQETRLDGERMRSGKVARVGLRVHDVFGEFAEW